VTADSLRGWCRPGPAAVEKFPFGRQTLRFTIGGKMFALTPLDARSERPERAGRVIVPL
jgi:predicted DNA-binding protein (MmcQ/YjbR family)